MEQRHISVDEAKQSREVFLVGSSLPIMPVVQVRSSCRVVEVPPHAGWGACVDYPVDGMRLMKAQMSLRCGAPARLPTQCVVVHATCVTPACSAPASHPRIPIHSGTPPPLATAAWASWRCRSAA